MYKREVVCEFKRINANKKLVIINMKVCTYLWHNVWRTYQMIGQIVSLLFNIHHLKLNIARLNVQLWLKCLYISDLKQVTWAVLVVPVMNSAGCSSNEQCWLFHDQVYTNVQTHFKMLLYCINFIPINSHF